MRCLKRAGRGRRRDGRIESEDTVYGVCLCGRTIRLDRLTEPGEHGRNCPLLALLETELVEPPNR